MYYIYQENIINKKIVLIHVRGFIPEPLDGIDLRASDYFLSFLENEMGFHLSADNSFMGYWVYRCDKFKDELHEVCIDIFETAPNSAQLNFCGYILTNYKIEL